MLDTPSKLSLLLLFSPVVDADPFNPSMSLDTHISCDAPPLESCSSSHSTIGTETSGASPVTISPPRRSKTPKAIPALEHVEAEKGAQDCATKSSGDSFSESEASLQLPSHAGDTSRHIEARRSQKRLRDEPILSNDALEPPSSNIAIGDSQKKNQRGDDHMSSVVANLISMLSAPKSNRSATDVFVKKRRLDTSESCTTNAIEDVLRKSSVSSPSTRAVTKDFLHKTLVHDSHFGSTKAGVPPENGHKRARSEVSSSDEGSDNSNVRQTSSKRQRTCAARGDAAGIGKHAEMDRQVLSSPDDSDMTAKGSKRPRKAETSNVSVLTDAGNNCVQNSHKLPKRRHIAAHVLYDLTQRSPSPEFERDIVPSHSSTQRSPSLASDSKRSWPPQTEPSVQRSASAAHDRGNIVSQRKPLTQRSASAESAIEITPSRPKLLNQMSANTESYNRSTMSSHSPSSVCESLTSLSNLACVSTRLSHVAAATTSPSCGVVATGVIQEAPVSVDCNPSTLSSRAKESAPIEQHSKPIGATASSIDLSSPPNGHEIMSKCCEAKESKSVAHRSKSLDSVVSSPDEIEIPSHSATNPSAHGEHETIRIASTSLFSTNETDAEQSPAESLNNAECLGTCWYCLHPDEARKPKWPKERVRARKNPKSSKQRVKLPNRERCRGAMRKIPLAFNPTDEAYDKAMLTLSERRVMKNAIFNVRFKDRLHEKRHFSRYLQQVSLCVLYIC